MYITTEITENTDEKIRLDDVSSLVILSIKLAAWGLWWLGGWWARFRFECDLVIDDDLIVLWYGTGFTVTWFNIFVHSEAFFTTTNRLANDIFRKTFSTLDLNSNAVTRSYAWFRFPFCPFAWNFNIHQILNKSKDFSTTFSLVKRTNQWGEIQPELSKSAS